MKSYCNMQGNLCRDVFIIFDEWNLEECIHPSLLPLYEGNQVPSYVGSQWRLDEDGVWVDRYGVRWPNDVPEGPTPDDPNYNGPWPIVKEGTETPEELSE